MGVVDHMHPRVGQAKYVNLGVPAMPQFDGFRANKLPRA